jgi:hypothetical protein
LRIGLVGADGIILREGLETASGKSEGFGAGKRRPAVTKSNQSPLIRKKHESWQFN